MSNLLVMGVSLLLGMALRYWKKLPPNTPAVLNGLIFYLPFPALTLLEFHKIVFTQDAALPALMAWIVFVAAGFFIVQIGKMRGWDSKTVGALALTSGLGNTSFVGYPLLESIYGPESLKVAVLNDQLGTFFVASTLGIFFAASRSGRKMTLKQIVRRVFSFPPIYSLILAFAMRPVPFSPVVVDTLSRIANTLGPIALVSVGFQLKVNWSFLKGNFKRLMVGLGYKLFLAPLLILVLYAGLFHVRGEAMQITLVEAAMAPMITSAVIAAEYGLNSELASLMVGVGIPLSFLSLPIWVWVAGLL